MESFITALFFFVSSLQASIFFTFDLVAISSFSPGYMPTGVYLPLFVTTAGFVLLEIFIVRLGDMATWQVDFTTQIN
jgi:hypothetical protein